MNYFFLLFFSLLEVISFVSGKSNPQGYLVNEVYSYADCSGKLTAKFSLAIGICVNSGLMGAPWIDSYMIYSLLDNGNVLATYYYDPICSMKSTSSEILKMNSCATSGNAIYFTYSQTLPNFSITDPIVEQTIYEYNGTTIGDTCEEGDYVVTYNALFRDTCQFDCHDGDESCLFTTCFNKTANVTYSDSYADGDTTDSCSSVITGREFLPTTCRQDIICYKSQSSPIVIDDDDFSPNPNGGQDDDDTDLSGGAIAGIVIALLVVLAVMGGIVYIFVQRRKPSMPPLEEKLVL